LHYTNDGRPVIDSPNQQPRTELHHLLNIPVDPTGKQLFSIEENDQLRRRLQHMLIFTDDNMGSEWRG
jgi:hypothetical protein